jgi:hypothetical protein
LINEPFDGEEQFNSCVNCELEFSILAELSYVEVKYCPFCGEYINIKSEDLDGDEDLILDLDDDDDGKFKSWL